MRLKRMIAAIIIISTLLACTGMVFAGPAEPGVWSHRIIIKE